MAIASADRASESRLPRGAVHGAAGWRKRLRREFSRVGAGTVSVYVDGPRGIAHMRFPGQVKRTTVDVRGALQLLGSLPDGAGPDTTLKALERTWGDPSHVGW